MPFNFKPWVPVIYPIPLPTGSYICRGLTVFSCLRGPTSGCEVKYRTTVVASFICKSRNEPLKFNLLKYKQNKAPGPHVKGIAPITYMHRMIYARNPSDLNISTPVLPLLMTGNWNLDGRGSMLEGASYRSWTVRFDTAPVIRFMFSV